MNMEISSLNTPMFPSKHDITKITSKSKLTNGNVFNPLNYGLKQPLFFVKLAHYEELNFVQPLRDVQQGASISYSEYSIIRWSTTFRHFKACLKVKNRGHPTPFQALSSKNISANSNFLAFIDIVNGGITSQSEVHVASKVFIKRRGLDTEPDMFQV